jgi:dienelactone hydrolase
MGASSPSSAAKPGHVLTYSGKLGAASYELVVPARWNRTLILYSHGYQAPGLEPGPAPDVADNPIGEWLLGHGYALAASSYSSSGWAVEQAVPDQLAVLDRFGSIVGSPARVIAWGHSLGGMVTAALVQAAPGRFAGALPMCGVLAGGVAAWNQALDSEYALRTLLSPQSTVQLVRITDPSRNLGYAADIIKQAQQTPQGRARLALVAALADEPGWFDPTQPEPAAGDAAGQEQNQYRWLSQVALPFGFAYRADIEKRAGGNPSWNTGVNYAAQLAASRDSGEVQALYAAAGLDLGRDLRALAVGRRVAADPGAIDYLTRNVGFSGPLMVPELTLHTTDDGLVNVEQEGAYAAAVGRDDGSDLLRQAFVHRAGHCFFTAAETIASFQLLFARVDSGAWPVSADEMPAWLARAAQQLGPALNALPVSNRPAAPAFVSYSPGPFLRP